MRYLFLTLSVYLFVLPIAIGQGQKKYPSLLWEISGNGLKSPSYLYGNMHVSDRVAFHLSDSFFVALKKTDVVALESDPSTWLEESLTGEEMEEMMRYRRYNSGFIEHSFVPDLYKKRDLMQMFKTEPSIVNGIMYRNNYGRHNYQENTYLDMFIFQAGKKSGKIVTNLEEPVRTRKMVEKAYESEYEDYEDYEYDEDEPSRWEVRELIEDAYRRGDLDALDSLSNISNPSKNYRKWMLDERNILMVRAMDSIMKNKTLFSAVGAAHLPGKMGVIELLREKGYTVRPVKYTSTKNAIKAKEKIENTFFPVALNSYQIEDGNISYLSNSEMIEVPVSKDGGKLYMNIELINGTYSILYRLRTRSLINGKSAEYVNSQIDSLLFENLPGKIQSKKKSISPEGYHITDILVKTKAADVLRYRVVVTPMEVNVFTIGGKGDVVMNKDFEKVMQSFKIGGSSVTWSAYENKKVGFKTDLPGLRSEFKDGSGTFMLDAYDPSTKDYFVIVKDVYNDLNYLESDTFELGYIFDNLAKEKEYKVLKREMKISNGYPVLTGSLKTNVGYMHLKLLTSRNNYIMQSVFSENENPNEAFFNSFSWITPDQDEKTKSHIDSTCFFTVIIPENTEISENEEFDYNRRYRYRYDYSEKEEEVDISHRGEVYLKNFFNPATSELIEVRYQRFSKYDKEKKDPVAEISMDLFLNKTNYKKVIREKNETESGRMIEYHYSDPESARIIHVKEIYNYGTKYTIKNYGDTVSGDSKFVTEFFNSFTLKDTVIGQTYWSDKKDLFFMDLMGDSICEAHALEYFGEIDFENKDVPKLLEYVKSTAYSKLEDEQQEEILEELTNLEHPSLIEFFDSKYKLVGDTANLQVLCLRGLLQQDYKKARELFMKNILENTPLSGENDADRIFNAAHDSLQLASQLFPAVFELTQYEEFKMPVYRLFSRLADSNLIDLKVMVPKLNSVLRDANEYIKRSANGMDSKDIYKSRSFKNGMSEVKKMIRSNPEMKGIIERELKAAGISLDQAFNLIEDNYLNSKIQVYASIFNRFKNEAASKSFFEKVEKSGNKALLLDLHLFYLKNNTVVADSVWKKYSADPATRILVYEALKRRKQEDKFDSFYFTQQSFVESQIIEEYELDLKTDSLVFIEKQFVENKLDTGYVFVYKIREGERENWRLAFVGYQPEDPLKVNTEVAVMERKYGVSKKQEKLDKSINEKMTEIRNEYRYRIQGSSRGDRYYDEYAEEAFED